MRRSDDVQDERGVCVLLHKRHFRHPWRSYVTGALDPGMGCSRITQEQLSRMRRSDDVQDERGVCVLLDNCSCIALISYIHVTMHKRHFRHPWRSYVTGALGPGMGCSRITQEQLSRMRRSDDVQDERGVCVLLDNCACIALISYIHVTMFIDNYLRISPISTMKYD
jgi:hypothetical protein